MAEEREGRGGRGSGGQTGGKAFMTKHKHTPFNEKAGLQPDGSWCFHLSFNADD